MPEAMNGKSHNRRAALTAVQSGWQKTAALVFVLLAAGLPEALGQQVLSWKFQEGDLLKYTTEQTTLMTIKIMGTERKEKRAQSATYTWSIKGVSAAGEADVTQRIERLTMKVEAAPFMPFEFDSNSPGTAVPQPFEGEVKMLKATVGAEFSFKMKPSGEITSIKIPDATLKRLKEALPEDAGGAEAFSQETLKEFVTQSSPPAFPTAALQPGSTWSPKANRMSLPLGTLVLERSFTFQGPDPKDPNLAQISMEGKVSLEPAANVTAKVRSQDGKGTLVFDKQKGRLVSSRGNQKTEMVISAMGQEIDQSTDMNSVMTLVP